MYEEHTMQWKPFYVGLGQLGRQNFLIKTFMSLLKNIHVFCCKKRRRTSLDLITSLPLMKSISFSCAFKFRFWIPQSKIEN